MGGGLSKETFGFLCNLIGEELRNSRRSFAISPEIQILVTLRYYATGAFQAVIGDHVHVHKSTICRTIKRVSQAICRLRSQFIDFPRNAEQKNMIQTGFFQLRGFPRVIGAVDCTHVKIQSPNANIGERFRNRKGWPGSVHDSTIFDNSMIRAQFENNEFGNCFLLGDGGYPCRDYLMTPLLNPYTEPEKRYQ
ncbi:putative nuclease HARBI1, partial [Acyrthosiphon pisum]|uniref:DDE Tnp4 domain-containing protein n=1 Tax=Acyrthosiphon pisum TaxID=7029 RepID=A0A8R2FCH9_ACYPI